jgi:site-specific DNA-methyltransferase (adenine-specific)
MSEITRHRIINGDSRRMQELSNRSVHLIITSPPYWQLKDYGQENQIGFHESYEEYINQLNLVWSECERVLHPGCRLCINIGDQFARSVYYGRYKVIPIRTEIIKFCEILGLDYMGAIIWQKVTTSNTTGGAAIMGSYPYPRNGILKLDYEFILIFKKQGNAPKPSPQQREAAAMTNEEWNTYFSGHWYFSGAKQDRHLAMFPEELPRRLIKMFSFPLEIILDPFMGSGTTALAAKNLGRHSVGYEINPDFIPIIQHKIESSTDLLNPFELSLEKQSVLPPDAYSIETLPYLFRDPHRLDKKVDVKKLTYGSKIDHNSSTRDDFFSVKKVISPELVELDNGLVVKLIGIKTDESKIHEAVEFIRQKVKGNKVFIKYDSQKFDEDNNLLVYLYLQNKTFINAHLIKNNLAQVDIVQQFKYKEKFIHYWQAVNQQIIPNG